MQKLNLNPILSQKLSPQKIQFIKLLQVPTAELEARIEEELEVNPALEEGKEEDLDQNPEDQQENYESEGNSEEKEINIEDYLSDDYGGYKMHGDGNYSCLLYTSPSPRDGLLSRMPS